MAEKERYSPGDAGGIWYEHWHRYHFALPLIAGLRVLDAASGEGYGTALLATRASQATGVDASPEAVAAARRRYGARANLEYVEGRCEALPLADASVDAVVSFETLEHLAQPEALVSESRRVLRPDGLFIVSSPHKTVERIVGQRFERVALFGQRLDYYSTIWPATAPPSGTTLLDAAKADPATPAPGIADAMCWIAVCGPAAAVEAAQGAVSLLSDRGHEVQAGAELAARHNAELRAYVQRLEAAYLASQEQLRQVAHERDALAAAQPTPTPRTGWNRK